MTFLVNGACGRMGQAMLRCIREKLPEVETIGIDLSSDGYRQLSDYPGRADCVIDFSHHTAAGALTEYCCATGTPLVIATTGHSEAELALISEAAKKIPVFHAANMSLGIALLLRLAKQTARLFPDADIEIVEIHHNQKLDAPSGTALALAQAIREVRPAATLVPGRSGHARRQKDDIGIHALRMGNVVGIHEVHVCTGTQTITLRHEAHDRSLFADGALDAARFLLGKPAGLYRMQDLLKEES